MAKRFTDTEKWRDEWWGSLPNDYRMIWLYLVDSCSIAGIWKKDFRGLNFNCNTAITESDFLKAFGDRLMDRGNYFFIPKFLSFQYPKGLNNNKPAILSVVKELNQNNLYQTVSELFGNDYLIIKDKDKVKDKEQDKEKDKVKDTDTVKDETPKNFFEPDVKGDDIIFPLDTKPVRELWAKWKESRWMNHQKRYGFYGEQAELKKLEGKSFKELEQIILNAISGKWNNLYGNGKQQTNGHSNLSKGQQQAVTNANFIKDRWGNAGNGKGDS